MRAEVGRFSLADWSDLRNGDLHEIQSIFFQKSNGHGFLIGDYMKDYTKFPEGPYVHPLWSLGR